MDNTYCYPDTDTLINKLNIHSQRKLLDAETQTVSIRLYQLQVQPISGNFDFKHLCSIHNHIFQDLYDWAGKPRTVDIAKGNSLFCPSWNIYGYADDVFRNFYKDCRNSSSSREQFIRVFSTHYADLNALHPFREGNGRSQREFCRELCLQCGYSFDLTHTYKDEMLQASIESLEIGDNKGLESIFRKCIIPLRK
ncbi:MAG: Fic family protein [Lachnospiraceae bacterium]